MSEVQHQSGKLVRLDRKLNETLEEQCKRVLEVTELDKYCSSYREQLQQTHYEEFIIHNDTLYQVKDLVKHDPDEDLFKIKKINGSDFEFEVKYYNGGCGLEEAIESAFEELEQ